LYGYLFLSTIFLILILESVILILDLLFY